ncbi:hypothetical protein GIB67_029445 [Kingdonia uniflora]|uniref:Uncharacterized protein n=1 Tax=Kingdonia uniflora TaxID=39325 RepID=A0A7J7NXX4_9MAGN|nr:hypothetical protein GIB67_029445 [Kingdonia uniflora]
MATLQFKDDCDSVKVGLREFDSSWTWQANELRATGSNKGHYHRSLASTDASAKSSLEIEADWSPPKLRDLGNAKVAITLPATKLGRLYGGPRRLAGGRNQSTRALIGCLDGFVGVQFYTGKARVPHLDVVSPMFRKKGGHGLKTFAERRVKFEAEIHRRLNSQAAKALCDSKEERTGVTRKGEGALQQDAAHFKGRDAREHRPYIYQKAKGRGTVSRREGRL